MKGLNASDITTLRGMPVKKIVQCLMVDGCSPLVSTMRGGMSPLWGSSNFGPSVKTDMIPEQPRRFIVLTLGSDNIEA